VDVLIAGGMGRGLADRLERRGIRALVTSETDPDRAVAAYIAGHLETLAAQCREGHGHYHDHGC
jgi:predicted Fe-Mo cluster-binding NifX family protein